MPNFRKPLSRRKFISRTSALAAGSVVAAQLAPVFRAQAARDNASPEFRSDWANSHDRVWLGPEYWANPLHDWQVANGRLELAFAGFDRNVHLLTRQLGERAGGFTMSAQVGRLDGARLAGQGSFGFRVGVMGPLREYRNSLFNGGGLNCGVTGEGGLFIGDWTEAQGGAVKLDTDSVELRLTAEPLAGKYKLTLTVLDATSGKTLGELSRDDIAPEQLAGNIALVANFGSTAPNPNAEKRANAKNKHGAGRFWFADWRVSGNKVEAHEDRVFGPIMFSSYTLSRGVMKMTAQMPPLGAQDSQRVRLQIKKGAGWKTIAEEAIHPESRTATFRIPQWNDKKDTPYRLAYSMRHKNGTTVEHEWTGAVRRDPVDNPSLSVADVS